MYNYNTKAIGVFLLKVVHYDYLSPPFLMGSLKESKVGNLVVD